jgi:FkbM family methyltransferase
MLLDLLALKDEFNLNITGAIHIGAHYGEELSVYNKIDSIKNVVMFEPAPANFKILQEKINDPKVILINKGLGPFSCRMDMNVETCNQGQSNSVLKPKLHLSQYPGITFNEKIEIKIEPLDKFEPSPFLNFINIDVQGFELEVFRGAKKTLKNVDYIMAEVNRDEVYENCAHVDELDSFLGTFGFTRVKTSWDGGIWGDALYLKNKN